MPDMAVVVGAGKSSTTLPSTGAKSTIDKTKPARTRKKGKMTSEKNNNKTNPATNTPENGVILAVQQRRQDKAKERQLKKQLFKDAREGKLMCIVCSTVYTKDYLGTILDVHDISTWRCGRVDPECDHCGSTGKFVDMDNTDMDLDIPDDTASTQASLIDEEASEEDEQDEQDQSSEDDEDDDEDEAFEDDDEIASNKDDGENVNKSNSAGVSAAGVSAAAVATNS